MPPPNRHGSPLKIVIKKIFGCPSESKPVLRQVIAGVNQNQRDSPFSLSPVSHPRRKICPLLLLRFLPRPPVFPLFQLRSVPGWAHRRGFRALLADVKQKRKESVNDSLTNISPSLFESTVCVCVRSYCCERKTDGLRDQWLGAWQCRHCEGKNPHGCADKAAGERAREGQGWLVSDYFCNVYQSRLLNLCFWWVAITRVANIKCLATQFQA